MNGYHERAGLREAIRQRGTIVACSHAVGVSRAHLANVVAGCSNPSRGLAERLARYTERDARELFPELGERERANA